MILKDLAYAWRTLRKSPAFTLTAVVTIALGIGASTAIFSVVHAVLLKPLPYPEPDRLTILWGEMRTRGVLDFPFSPPDFDDVRLSATLLDGVTGITAFRTVVSGENAESEQIAAANVTTNFFRLLGGKIALGRDFIDADATPAPPRPQPPAGQPAPPPPQRLTTMVVISHEFWQHRYGGDPQVIGRAIDLGAGAPGQIVGVLAPGFELLFPPKANIERAPAVWGAARLDFKNSNRNNVFLRVVARMKPGVSLQQAQAQLDGIAANLRSRFPIKTAAGFNLHAEGMQDNVVAAVRPAILALMGAVIFLLLIACANVGNLLLLRASARARELAVRTALGGSRWNLIRQMMAESLLLAGSGAVAGLLLARFGIDLLLWLGPRDLPRLTSISLDQTVLAFTALSALAAAALFGIVPALKASGPQIMDVLRSTGRTAGLGSGRVLRNAVVMAEVALSFVLLIGCGLMVRSFIALQKTNPGFEARGLLTLSLPITNARGPQQVMAMVRNIHDRFAELPGVTAVTAGSPFPLDGGLANMRWGLEDAVADPARFRQANVFFVLPGYFETLRTKLIEGRTFTEADNSPDAKVVVIDRILASKAFPHGSAVGKRLFMRVITPEPLWYDVIGVVEHQRHESLSADGREAGYFTDGYAGPGAVGRWALRVPGDPAQLAPLVRAAVARIDKRLATADVQPMQTFVDQAQAQTRFSLALIAIFAAIAALLAAVGLYGVLSNAVRQRTAEIGLRMALGAAPGSVFGLVVGHGLRLSAAGIGLGLIAAFSITRVMRSMLVGVAPHDPATFAVIAGLFFVIAAVACWLPARRAAGMDPTVALREE
ncbi:MAG TPA: ABC transporter permease [Candidatus Acidoferrales bacterium]|jgi:predicted permease|nr:ABC transporter permease [Candidatus Acidoferrales bacterium]